MDDNKEENNVENLEIFVSCIKELTEKFKEKSNLNFMEKEEVNIKVTTLVFK